MGKGSIDRKHVRATDPRRNACPILFGHWPAPLTFLEQLCASLSAVGGLGMRKVLFTVIGLLLVTSCLSGCGSGERYQDQHFWRESERWSGGSSE
jgi:hypothetical protein